jgi:hypothetical protein
MAKVPTARSQRIGTQVTQAPQTPFQAARTSVEMFGGTEARQVSQLGEALASASDQFQQAQAVIQNREDAIARSREYGQFFAEMSDEFDRVQAESDMTSSQTISDYNQLLDAAAEKALAGHANRSPESYAKFAQRIDSAKTQFATTLTNNVRTEQRAYIANQYENQFKDLASKVQSGEMSLAEASIQSDQYLSDIDPALPNSEVMGLQDAAEQAIAIGAINRFANAGQYEELSEFMNSNPSIVASLPTNVTQKYVDMVQQARSNEVKRQAAFAAKEDQYRQVMGLPPGAPIPTSVRMSLMGIPMPKARVPLTDAGKVIADREYLKQQHGEDSEQVRMYDLVQSSAPKPNSPLGKLIADKRAAEERGDVAAVNAYDAAIKAENPNYQREQEYRASFVKVQNAITRETDNLNILQKNVGKVLELVTGIKYTGGNDRAFMEAVRKRVVEEDFESFVTGIPGKMLSTYYPSSTAAEIEQMMKQFQGHIAFGALQRMREASPSNGALGNVSNFEIDRLQAQMGSLDIFGSPVAAANTLIRLFEQTPRTIEMINNAFKADYAFILNEQTPGEGQDQPRQTKGGPTDLTEGGNQPAASAPTTQPAPVPGEQSPSDMMQGGMNSASFDLVSMAKLPEEQQVSIISDAVGRGAVTFMSQEGRDQLADYLASMDVNKLKDSPDGYKQFILILDALEGDGDKQ